jgi:hypothetical protein
MAFTFGQLFLQGLAQGSQQRQSREELAFRKESQDFINQLNRDRFNQSVREFERTQGFTEEQASVSNAFQAQQLAQQSVGLGIQQQRADLDQQQFDLLSDTHVTVPTRFGEGKITVSDLIGTDIARGRLNLARDQTRPIQFGEGDVDALNRLVNEGDFGAVSGRTFDHRLAPTINFGVQTSLDEVGRRQRSAAIDFFDTQDAVRGIQEEAARIDPIDRSRIQQPTSFFNDLVRGFFGESAQEAAERINENEARGTTTLDEAIETSEAHLDLVQSIRNLPAHQQGPAAASIAHRMSTFADDAGKIISGSTLSNNQKRELTKTFEQIGRFHLQNAPRGDQAAQALNSLLNQAIEDEDMEAMLEVIKAIGAYRGVETRAASAQSLIDQRQFGQLTGQ